MKKSIIFALSILLAFSAATAAQPTLKERVKARIPKVNALLVKGSVGLDANGYLISRTTLANDEALIIAEENKDRKTMHAAIAKKSGSPIAKVEKRSALKFIERLPKGAFYKNAKGEWTRK